MRLLPRRGAAAGLRLHPPGPLRPTETVTATVELASAVDRVDAARVELGYVNRYPYRWAGRRASASLGQDLDPFSPAELGTGYGTDRDTEDWVHVLDVPLAVVGRRLEAERRDVALRLPSWAPGSSEAMVRWVVRLHVERAGRDVTVDEALSVLVAPPASAPEQPHERLSGAGADVRIVPDRDWWRPGEELRGTVAITPTASAPSCALELRIQRVRVSHPLVRTPGDPQVIDRPFVTAGTGIPLEAGVRTTVPFAIAVPADAAPTTETVHASLGWFVHASVAYPRSAGLRPDRARRGFGVFTA